MSSKEEIRDFYGHKLGEIETDSNGKQTARDFYGHILGRYDPRDGKTRDFYGKILSQGNTLSGLIMSWNNGGQR